MVPHSLRAAFPVLLSDVSYISFMYLQAWALENVVVPMARMYDLEEEYQYLRPSIKRFPKGREQVQMAISAGFSKAVHYEIGFGLMGVLVATSS